MVTYLDAIALGHLNPTIRENGLDGAFFLQCAQEDLQAIGIGRVQWKKITMYMPQWQAGRWRRCLASPAVGGAALPAQPLAVLSHNGVRGPGVVGGGAGARATVATAAYYLPTDLPTCLPTYLPTHRPTDRPTD